MHHVPMPKTTHVLVSYCCSFLIRPTNDKICSDTTRLVSTWYDSVNRLIATDFANLLKTRNRHAFLCLPVSANVAKYRTVFNARLMYIWNEYFWTVLLFGQTGLTGCWYWWWKQCVYGFSISFDVIDKSGFLFTDLFRWRLSALCFW